MQIVGNVSDIAEKLMQLREYHAPPDHLGRPERELWDRVLNESDLGGTIALSLLAAALDCRQRARSRREVITREGVTVRGKHGPRPHLLLGVERAVRQQLVSILRKLRVTL